MSCCKFPQRGMQIRNNTASRGSTRNLEASYNNLWRAEAMEKNSGKTGAYLVENESRARALDRKKAAGEAVSGFVKHDMAGAKITAFEGGDYAGLCYFGRDPEDWVANGQPI